MCVSQCALKVGAFVWCVCDLLVFARTLVDCHTFVVSITRVGG